MTYYLFGSDLAWVLIGEFQTREEAQTHLDWHNGTGRSAKLEIITLAQLPDALKYRPLLYTPAEDQQNYHEEQLTSTVVVTVRVSFEISRYSANRLRRKERMTVMAADDALLSDLEAELNHQAEHGLLSQNIIAIAIQDG